MTDFLKLFDYYSTRARLFPALLTLLPMVFAVVVWLPSAATIGQKVLAIAGACGVFYFLADFARSQGKRIEPRLLKSWGGWPTTLWLRHSDTNLTADVTSRYHAFFARQRGLTPLPTAEAEKLNPAAADQLYASAVTWLKERCRGKDFPLVEKENAAYGFRRNMLGLKPFAIPLAVLIFLFPAMRSVLRSIGPMPYIPPQLLEAYTLLPVEKIAAIAFALVAAVLWSLAVNARWVRAAGDQYARSLLANCDSLEH